MTEFEKEIALIEKMGLKTSPLRLEYEKKVHELRSMPEKLKAEGYTEDQIARAMHEKRRELADSIKRLLHRCFVSTYMKPQQKNTVIHLARHTKCCEERRHLSKS